MQNEAAIKEYWRNFLISTNRTIDLQYYFCDCMGPTEEIANELVSLILSGTKTATTSCLPCYQIANEPLPKVGDLSIITDWYGNPKCVIETTNITILPFQDVTFDICKREGEDENLQSWQNTHFEIFTDEGKQEGYTFTWDTHVVFEDFKVIYQQK